MSYQVKVNVFEGPYDLLLFLIKKGEVDIYDIPIAKVAKAYLDYIELMRSLDLEIAGEFIVMAATLMRIKAKMLLPVYVEAEEEIVDPRTELVQNLLEYQRIQNAAERFEEYEGSRLCHFTRGNVRYDLGLEKEEEYLEMQMSVYELMLAFEKIIKEKKVKKFHVVEPEPYTVEERIDEILKILEGGKKVSFQKILMDYNEKIIIVINFLAILELVRMHRVRITQSQPFQEIWIYQQVHKGRITDP